MYDALKSDSISVIIILINRNEGNEYNENSDSNRFI